MTQPNDSVRGDLQAVRDSLDSLTSAILVGADATEKAMKRRTRLEKIVYVVASVVGVAALIAAGVGILVLVALGQVRNSQDAIRHTQNTNLQVLAAIRDCTDPTGECAKRGAASQATAVGAINDAGLVNVWCALNTKTLVEARACVAANR